LVTAAGVRFTDVQFSPDHQLLLAAAHDGSLRIWKWNRGQPDPANPVNTLLHPDYVHGAQFSQDGKHVLTGCRDKHARLWDWQAEKVLWTVTHDHEVRAVAFSPDRTLALSGGDDITLRIWDARTGIALAPALPLSGMATSVSVTRDGKHAVVGAFGKAIHVFRLDGLQADTRQAADLIHWGEILSGLRAQEGGGVTPLTDKQWLDAWRAYRLKR
jgi:WD40 repeat protein